MALKSKSTSDTQSKSARSSVPGAHALVAVAPLQSHAFCHVWLMGVNGRDSDGGALRDPEAERACRSVHK